MEYDLEIEKVIEKSKEAKRILLQLPDGLKEEACEIAEKIESKGKIVFIWAGSCFGACDIPRIPKEFNIDLILHFGHSKMR
jgi:2-(3-amino-3-carboxypropyl)histidine synthase